MGAANGINPPHVPVHAPGNVRERNRGVEPDQLNIDSKSNLIVELQFSDFLSCLKVTNSAATTSPASVLTPPFSATAPPAIAGKRSLFLPSTLSSTVYLLLNRHTDRGFHLPYRLFLILQTGCHTVLYPSPFPVV
ncbi:hypothetical protein L1887_21797 [Cichorium endivia]|nr:hypothetical protein L1887_21797 [Cichorium endivia]